MLINLQLHFKQRKKNEVTVCDCITKTMKKKKWVRF